MYSRQLQDIKLKPAPAETKDLKCPLCRKIAADNFPDLKWHILHWHRRDEITSAAFDRGLLTGTKSGDGIRALVARIIRHHIRGGILA